MVINILMFILFFSVNPRFPRPMYLPEEIQKFDLILHLSENDMVFEEILKDKGEMDPIRVTIEVGKKRTFASALDWPGWSRSCHEEDTALQALLDAGPRYALILLDTGLGFKPRADQSAFTVVSHQEGNATTDFGTPGAVLAGRVCGG